MRGHPCNSICELFKLVPFVVNDPVVDETVPAVDDASAVIAEVTQEHNE